jgi:hypothetical protein
MRFFSTTVPSTVCPHVVTLPFSFVVQNNAPSKTQDSPEREYFFYFLSV